MGAFIDKTRGRIKRAVGVLTGNDKIEREGERDEIKGKAEAVVEDVKDTAKAAKKSIEDVVK